MGIWHSIPSVNISPPKSSLGCNLKWLQAESFQFVCQLVPQEASVLPISKLQYAPSVGLSTQPPKAASPSYLPVDSSEVGEIQIPMLQQRHAKLSCNMPSLT